MNFLRIKDMNKRFLYKTQMLLYVLIFLACSLAVFNYAITGGTSIFTTVVLLIMAWIGAITAVDAKKKESEIDAFMLYYGINKIKNGKKKKI